MELFKKLPGEYITDIILRKIEKSSCVLHKLKSDNSFYADESLTDEFFQKYTKYNSFDDMLAAGGFPTDLDEFQAFPTEPFDKFIHDNTRFLSWKDLFYKATMVHILKKCEYEVTDEDLNYKL